MSKIMYAAECHSQYCQASDITEQFNRKLAERDTELATAHARIADLRLALREVITIVGGFTAPEVSNAFLATGAPAETKAVLAQRDTRIATLEAERDAAVKNGPLRMYLALQMLRAWNSGTQGFEALTVSTVNKWIDDGMSGPIPWPESPFFAEWAEKRGFSNIDGYVGFRATVTSDAARAGKAGE